MRALTAVCRRAAALAGVAAICMHAHIHAQVPSWSLEAQRRLIGGAGTDVARQVAERQRLAEEGEAALARGDTVAAERAFDSAARVVHSADIEMGLVRTYMQAGDYRRALTFASHAAGAHRHVPGGTALYSWLLHIGGQGVAARRYLDEALVQWPDDPALRQSWALLTASHPLPADALMSPPLRAAPYASPDSVPGGAHAAGTALLLADGRRAVVPAATVQAKRSVWLRNAMGQTVAAEAVPAAATDRMVVLSLASALPAVPWLAAPPREPFAGSPAYTVEYVATERADASWPLLHQGFFGRHLGTAGDRLLGIDLAPGPRGGPVFDAQGRLAGMALPGADGRDRLEAADSIARLAGAPAAGAATVPGDSSAASSAAPVERVGADALYELAMRVTLQVLVQP
jgi:hypothetical protein